MAPPAWTLDQTRILTLNQVKRVLEDLERRSRRYRSTLTNTGCVQVGDLLRSQGQ